MLHFKGKNSFFSYLSLKEIFLKQMEGCLLRVLFEKFHQKFKKDFFQFLHIFIFRAINKKIEPINYLNFPNGPQNRQCYNSVTKYPLNSACCCLMSPLNETRSQQSFYADRRKP